MAFFGEDGLQRQLKQVQRDLMEKGTSFGLSSVDGSILPKR
jgi:hypothetical protein